MAFFRSPFEDDPFFSSRPSFMMESPLLMDPHYRRSRQQQLMGPPQARSDHHPTNSMMMMSPFGGMDPFRHMESMMSNFHRMMEQGGPSASNGSSYSQSTVMHFSSSTGQDGKPQIYQASSSTRRAPGGIQESRKMERDSTTGVQKMSVSHQIGDRSHTVQKKVNVKTNEREENHELINIEEEEEQSFNREWDTKTRSLGHTLEAPRRTRVEARGLPMATSSTHMGRPRPDHSPSTHPRVHPYTRSEGVVNEDGRRRKKGTRVAFN